MSGVSVTGLEVRLSGREAPLLGRLDLRLDAGDCLGLVGESGSGKSLTALALLDLLPPGLTACGELQWGGLRAAIGSPAHRALRGRRIAWMPQDALASLHPLRRIGAQLIESLRALRGFDAAAARAQAIALLEQLELPTPAQLLARYPHQLSGGQRQRVNLALALAGDAQLLVADEPTSALDPRLAREMLDLLDRLRRERGLSLLLISHDLPLVGRYAQRVMILRRGQLLEAGDTARVFARPQHEYTRDLLAAVPQDSPVILAPGKHALVPTALAIALPPGFEAQVRPRSGLAAKHGVTVLNSPGTIDADYRGEISVILINHGQEPFVIKRGERIAQMVIAPVVQAVLVPVAALSSTDRGSGGFGSTGR